ncbi:MAG TPA: hypothetical protein VH413_00580 [Verrucomicrobiae bacterium]|nr:hypothetical protein [Verrucomicrobiae bacterium]
MTQPLPAWQWENYPLSDQLQLATLSCKVQAKNSFVMVSPMSGLLRLHVATFQTNLAVGEVWAEMESDLLISESNALAEAKSKMEQREKTLQELELPRQKLKLTRDLWEAERQEALTGWLLTNQDLAASVSDLKTPDLRSESLSLAHEESLLLRRGLEELAKTNLVLSGVDLDEQRAEWDRRELEFKRKQEMSQIKMPFSGQLTVSLLLADGVTQYPVSSGQELGVARDLSQIQVRVALYDSAWAALPPSSLRATIQESANVELEATFACKKIERAQFREEPAAYFVIRPEDVARAGPMVGMEVPGALWLKLEKPMRIVPKLALILYCPAYFQRRNWTEGVTHICPGAKVVAEGQADVAIDISEVREP